MHKRTVADSDPWLEPYKDKLLYQLDFIEKNSQRITGGHSLSDLALGYLYFGLIKGRDGWTFREWAPNATAIYLICENNNWTDEEAFRLNLVKDSAGIWELSLPLSFLKHGDKYKLRIHWSDGSGERIPSYAKYVVQDESSGVYDAVVWSPQEEFRWSDSKPLLSESPLLIYEAHVGMSSEEETVASYRFFADNVLPRIKDLGYNAVQLMAIQEHPYYASFGYHVSNFFAPSSRFGNPDDLKYLINKAHVLGLKVIMDIVHSHAVKNELEGLSRFDGSYDQYFHKGLRGYHEAWDSCLFDYGKSEVVHFLLSNVRYWLEEFKFDGFRFDGVTSMIYINHGLGQNFSSYDDYFSDNIDLDALTYLSMASQLSREINPDVILIAEDMSAYPGLAAPLSEGGIGFDYRLSMGVPDFWIKTLKERSDEAWDLNTLFHELTSHRPEEKTISYSESHDQALVGDKTIIFRLIDKDMYDFMSIGNKNITVERGIALHKIIRLLTSSTNGGGYLNFMGNEFGHPEWIDFPREGNAWSYKYARRQWSLVDNRKLLYKYLNNYDKAMVELLSTFEEDTSYHWVNIEQNRGLLSFVRCDRLFVFNISPNNSYESLEIPTFSGIYRLVLSSDDIEFGGQGRVDKGIEYVALDEKVKIYIPSRVALVFELITAEPK